VGGERQEGEERVWDVMLVICYLLFVICYLLFVICYWSLLIPATKDFGFDVGFNTKYDLFGLGHLPSHGTFLIKELHPMPFI